LLTSILEKITEWFYTICLNQNKKVINKRWKSEDRSRKKTIDTLNKEQ
jgi:hypothetical protein